MRRLLTLVGIAAAIATATLHVRDLHATAGFTPGNLVVYRVGDGSAALTGNAAAVFLDEYTPSGTFVQSFAMPTAAIGNNRALTASGSATSEGELTRSVDGQYLVAAGYNAAPGTASVTSSTSANVNRVIARVDSTGTIDTTTALTDAISGGNPRGAVSTDGHDLWISGTSSGGGIRYATFGATTSTSLSTTVTNLRHTGIFGGQLYVSTASGSAVRLGTVGSGTPKASGQTITELIGIPPSLPSPYSFFFADLDPTVPGVDTLYIADDSAAASGGGILKFSLSGVTNMWVANGTISSGLGLRALTGTVTASGVTLFAVGSSGSTSPLVTLTDPSGYNQPIAGTLTTLATAGTNTVFRGVAFAPVAAGPTNPTGVGSANPNSVAAGSPTLLTVTVTPGANPASSALAVTADLSAIGGSATQQLFDDGTNGDATAGDNIFSFQATVSASTGVGPTSMPATITDAQARTGSATIALTIAAPVSLSGVGAANPASVLAGNATLLTVVVMPANAPASTGIGVTADLSSIGGSAVQTFFDDGTHGDQTNGDRVFSFLAAIPPDAGSGTTTLPFTITDAQNRSASGGISLTVNGSVPPTGTGSAAPASVPAGSTTQITVNVTPGANPTSTGLSVVGDLTSIGGSNTQVFQSSGNTFSFSATVDAATPLGPKTLPITVSDAQGRSTGFTIPLTVTAPLANSTIVISQVYPGGGNTNPTYANDFVQLYNRGTTTVDITGWSLQYDPATGTGDWSSRQPLAGTIAPGQYYLIAMASNGGGGAPLPPANVSSQINMGQSAGKVALSDNADLLTGPAGCPTSTHVMDMVGYGATANCWEGTGPATVPGPLTTTALFRQSGGFIDTNDNKSDFAIGTPQPLSSSPIVPLPPYVFDTYPAVNGTDVPRDATIEVTFAVAATVDPGWFDVHCTTTASHDDATEVPDGFNRWITPNTNFVPGEACTVTVFKSKVHDAQSGLLSPPQDYSWSFTVASGAPPPESADVHLLMGNPTNATADPNQPTNYLMSKPEYALSYNRDLGRPNWVSWHLTDAWIPSTHPSRVDTFRPDPAVPPDWYRVQSFDFSGSGFDRGHMDPNADRESSLPVNQATFLMSNMVAQSPDNNQGPWADFENYLRSVVHGDPAHLNEIYIVSGPAGTGGTGSNGGTTTTVAGGHVTVPASTWKVALVLPDNGSEDDLSRVNCSTPTLAVIMPNVQGIKTNPWQTYQRTISDVVSLTGYHFFTNLPQPIQHCLETGVKNDQTIAFGPIVNATFGVDVPLQAIASSGLPATLTVTSGPATIVNGTTLHFTDVGMVTVVATQAGDVNYNAAAPVSQSFQVMPASQTITFDAPAPTPTYGDAAFQVSATGGASGNPVTFAASGACSASSQPGVATITILSAGVCTLTASQAGGADYSAAPTVSETIVISKATPSFTGLTSTTIEAGTATTTTAGTIAYGALTPTGAVAMTLNGVTQTAAVQANGSFASAFATALLPPAATPYAIAYSYGGDTNFNAATGVGSVTVVDTTPPALTLPANIAAPATSPAGAAVPFTASATDLVDGARPIVCTPASGSTFAVGSTIVTCTASDTRGNTATGSFSVTVTTATVPGRMIGDASIQSGTVTQTAVFGVQEGASGADLGALLYTVRTSQRGPGQLDTFTSTTVTNVAFFNVPGVSPGHKPASGVDTVSFSGVGRWNGRSGYSFDAVAVDAGEPGRGRDTFAITIRDASGHVVSTANATITDGNIQSLRMP
ncbi:MAG TPA: DNA/RNA non-specific endonuclease [Vicinamibacterales bacterium]|nr:DNA/RNA non-specific endonuclease [Vicinamibacterales bacterium]